MPKEVTLVFDYLVNIENPEYFGETHLQPRPIRWSVIDIDDDGIIEVFLQTFPHFRQSPTITIFQIHKNDSVGRIVEGFAPGHLIPLSIEDDYYDSHTTGSAIDMSIDNNDQSKIRTVGETSLNWGMSVVLYKNFIHTDQREAGMIFIDLLYLNDYSSENTCENFQFSMPDEIAAGTVKNISNKCFIARVGEELFCYEISGFKESKFVNKEVTIMKLPNGFERLEIVEGRIMYVNNKGKLLELKK